MTIKAFERLFFIILNKANVMDGHLISNLKGVEKRAEKFLETIRNINTELKNWLEIPSTQVIIEVDCDIDQLQDIRFQYGKIVPKVEIEVGENKSYITFVMFNESDMKKQRVGLFDGSKDTDVEKPALDTLFKTLFSKPSDAVRHKPSNDSSPATVSSR